MLLCFKDSPRILVSCFARSMITALIPQHRRSMEEAKRAVWIQSAAIAQIARASRLVGLLLPTFRSRRCGWQARSLHFTNACVGSCSAQRCRKYLLLTWMGVSTKSSFDGRRRTSWMEPKCCNGSNRKSEQTGGFAASNIQVKNVLLRVHGLDVTHKKKMS